MSPNVIKHIREPARVISEASQRLSAPFADEELTQLFYALLSEDLEGALDDFTVPAKPEG